MGDFESTGRRFATISRYILVNAHFEIAGRRAVIRLSSRPLPIPLPVPADRRVQGRAEDGDVLGLVVAPAVILAPRGFRGVLVQVLLADVVVLADDGAAQAGEVAFRLIGAGAVEAVGEAVVDAERVVGGFHVIPMRAFVGVQHGPEGHPLADDWAGARFFETASSAAFPRNGE
jgi:hypothetical protein